ncbi:response regulator transcription factor [Nonomuraea sp. SYSU D8015]|uniref:response regulator transcription factor n=1 Tax=Nonomuraea sp. SYSU D8015 TaxID=2593644 RepID=UPI001660E9DA|nr:LuxR C-terminal-related transcriptional regulator [Nonomuraea sp. SYSU D8015]
MRCWGRGSVRGRAESPANKEIVEQLSVSEGTIKTHLSRLMAKLGLTSRAQAVVLSYDCGLVEPATR